MHWMEKVGEVLSTIRNVILQKGDLLKITKNYPATCLQPLDLRVSLKLCEQHVSHHFTHISFHNLYF